MKGKCFNMRKYLILMIAFLLTAPLLSGSATAAKIYIDVDSPNFQLFPIAITDFDAAPEAPVKTANAGVALAEETKKYLLMTGFFNPLNKKSFLDDATGTSAPNRINYANWVMIGADYLLKGSIQQNDKQTSADARLFDVIKGEPLFHKEYTAAGNDLRPLAKSMASDILYTLTGDEGEFNTRIAYVSKKGQKGDIYTIDYDGSDLKVMTSHRSIIMAPRWSPDGSFMAFTSFKDGHPEVYIRDLKTGTEKKVASFEGLNLCGYWSPDSKYLLLTLSKDGNEELYMLEVDTLQLQRLMRSYSIDVSPAWSPNGKKIAFVSNRGGSPQIYVMDLDGSNIKRITFEGNYNTSPSWSPRGGRIAFEGLINGKYQIFTIDEEGNNLLQLTFDAANNESPSWSPSGRQIAFSSKTNQKSKICVMNANGLNVRVLYESTDTLAMPTWSPRLK
jgi:TolB protein